MDYSSILKSELFRPFSIIFVPGAIALWPLIPIFVSISPLDNVDLLENPGLFGLGFIVFSIALGLIFDSIGSHVESLWDWIWNKINKTHSQDWDNYLQLKIGNEIVGQRYLQTRVLMLKFELSLIPASLLMAYLCTVGVKVSLYLGKEYFLIAKWIGIVLAIIMVFESFFSVWLLGKTRKTILKAASNP